jgi:hypothetical protein
MSPFTTLGPSKSDHRYLFPGENKIGKRFPLSTHCRAQFAHSLS